MREQDKYLINDMKEQMLQLTDTLDKFLDHMEKHHVPSRFDEMMSHYERYGQCEASINKESDGFPIFLLREMVSQCKKAEIVKTWKGMQSCVYYINELVAWEKEYNKAANKKNSEEPTPHLIVGI